MDQPNLFEDNVYDAFESLVRSLGGWKRVAHELWPEKGIEAGANNLRDSLNPNRREKLSLEEVVRLLQMGQKKGDHIAIERICKDSGYEAPRAVNQEQQVEELQKEFISKADQLLATFAEIQKAGAQLKAVD